MGAGDLELTAEERAALIGMLRRALDEARFPFSRRYAPLKAILAKLDLPSEPQAAFAAEAGTDPRAREEARKHGVS